jgi:hypothetical protein
VRVQPTPAEYPPIIWRTSPVIAASLYLVTAALVAVAFYLDIPALLRLGIAILALVFAGTATFAARLIFVADDEGLFVRRLTRSDSPDWADVLKIDVVQVGKTGMTIAIDLRDGRQLLLPPSLILPTTPHGLVSTHALLESKAQQLRLRGKVHG